MSRPRLSRLVLETLSDEQRRTYDAVHAGRPGGTDALGGRIAGPLTIWLHAPLIGKAQQELGSVLRFKLTLSARIAELVILSVAHAAGAEFQIVAHEPMAYDAGLTHDQIESLRERREPELEDPVERTAWRTVSRLLTNGSLDDAEYAEAVASLGESGLVELVTLVGYYRLLALQMRVFGVSVHEYRGPRLPDRG